MSHHCNLKAMAVCHGFFYFILSVQEDRPARPIGRKVKIENLSLIFENIKSYL
jgi:hypothetical protein